MKRSLLLIGSLFILTLSYAQKVGPGLPYVDLELYPNPEEQNIRWAVTSTEHIDLESRQLELVEGNRAFTVFMYTALKKGNIPIPSVNNISQVTPADFNNFYLKLYWYYDQEAAKLDANVGMLTLVKDSLVAFQFGRDKALASLNDKAYISIIPDMDKCPTDLASLTEKSEYLYYATVETNLLPNSEQANQTWYPFGGKGQSIKRMYNETVSYLLYSEALEGKFKLENPATGEAWKAKDLGQLTVDTVVSQAMWAQPGVEAQSVQVTNIVPLDKDKMVDILDVGMYVGWVNEAACFCTLVDKATIYWKQTKGVFNTPEYKSYREPLFTIRFNE